MTTLTPSHIADLKGSPASILLALLFSPGHNYTTEELASTTGYSIKAVGQGLKALLEKSLINQHSGRHNKRTFTSAIPTNLSRKLELSIGYSYDNVAEPISDTYETGELSTGSPELSTQIGSIDRSTPDETGQIGSIYRSTNGRPNYEKFDKDFGDAILVTKSSRSSPNGNLTSATESLETVETASKNKVKEEVASSYCSHPLMGISCSCESSEVSRGEPQPKIPPSSPDHPRERLAWLQANGVQPSSKARSIANNASLSLFHICCHIAQYKYDLKQGKNIGAGLLLTRIDNDPTPEARCMNCLEELDKCVCYRKPSQEHHLHFLPA